uniref:endolytic transglycosylase MltG n=1 Tax=uncultured Desulfovibrio sp. TaxID=167968 RepID=UPI0028043BE3
MKFLLRLVILLLLVALAGGAWLWREARLFLDTPAGQPGTQEIFDVPPGARLGKIAEELAARGLVTSARNFVLLARWKKQENRLQAGRFALEGGWRPEQVLDALVNGKPVLQRVTVPEGLTWWQTGRLLESAGLLRFEDFREAVTDPAFLRHYGIPFATAEGFLMPDTYLLKPPDASAPASPDAPPDAAKAAGKARARAVAGRMIDNFWRKTAALWPDAGGRQGVAARPPAAELKKWVTLASIVEKETGIPAERARVAGVYENRL